VKRKEFKAAGDFQRVRLQMPPMTVSFFSDRFERETWGSQPRPLSTSTRQICHGSKSYVYMASGKIRFRRWFANIIRLAGSQRFRRKNVLQRLLQQFSTQSKLPRSQTDDYWRMDWRPISSHMVTAATFLDEQLITFVTNFNSTFVP
jgi:hypothetical protein